ncbi:HD domain-containing protein [Clostridium pasteurianum]|uniref:Putative HD superfamily hydrolase n=1 Tax=Clostridium pasteurianum BC1 TaxID=86416 RepID=R4KER7_CLOPA|nr:HD domain-containing protein [Clostridium pasteurianum]AGK99024.1 putative HD superfamily hydrolase [Clostridium pasteurianum BC1]
MKDIKVVKEQILNLLSNVQKPGMDKLIMYLVASDFFVAPASTKYHGNYDGGLAEHSLNVYELLKEKNERFQLGLSEDTVVVTALLHDFCKINFYNKQTCWKKNDSNRWESYEGYKVQDDFPVGHGEKSVIMIQNFIRLTKQEILLIRWHMGNTEPKEMQMNLNNAWELFPAAVALHTADMEASYLLEQHIEPGQDSNQVKFSEVK